MLLDLDPCGGHLPKLAGPQDGEGLAEALQFGISLQAAGFPLEPGVRFVPTGRLPRGGLAALLEHPGWERILSGAARRNIRLLAYIRADENLPLLAPLAGGALLLATPGEELNLRALLPHTLQVLGAIEPAARPRGPTDEESPTVQQVGDSTVADASPGVDDSGSPDRTERSDEEPPAMDPAPGAEAGGGRQPPSANADPEGSFASIMRAVTSKFDRRQTAQKPQSRTGFEPPTSPGAPTSSGDGANDAESG